jgi:hypothetical protein
VTAACPLNRGLSLRVLVRELAAGEQIAELGALLAAGLVRALPRKSSGYKAEPGESSLDFSAGESGDPTPMGIGGADD